MMLCHHWKVLVEFTYVVVSLGVGRGVSGVGGLRVGLFGSHGGDQEGDNDEL